MTLKHLCNLVVPGAAKSGTSSLHEYLALHPDICMSKIKEPHFFSRDSEYNRGAQALNSLFVPRSPKPRVYGESSTGYLVSPTALQRVSRDLDAPKAIIILRPPIDRTFSHYRWRYRLGLEKRPFLDAIQEDGFGYDPNQTGQFGHMAYLQFSKYSNYCPMWQNTLGKENCLFLSTTSLRDQKDATLRACYRFLGLPPIDTPTIAANRTDKIPMKSHPFLTSMAAKLPLRLRRSRMYQAARDALLVGAAPMPPSEMTERERRYVSDALKEDTDYYRSVFPHDMP